MQNEVRVGDVVAWRDVPDGALVRDGAGDFCLRLRNRGLFVFTGNRGTWLAAEEYCDAAKWEWRWPDSEAGLLVAIITLNLTGQETAADLQRLAEVYEVRESLEAMLTCPYCDNEEPAFETFEDGTVSQPWCTECDSEMGDPGLTDEAERLHRVGWKPGMTAEDAARMLAEAGR